MVVRVISSLCLSGWHVGIYHELRKYYAGELYCELVGISMRQDSCPFI